MKTLTAKRCRQLIGELSFERDNHGMSNQKYDYLEALEIALPVLEQQEKGDDGWIEWGGGKCPVDSSVMIEPKLRSGKIMPSEIAVYWNWQHQEWDGDIIAYRVIDQQECERGEEE